MAVVESWKISGICQCSACEEARAEQARDRRINAPPLISKESGRWAIHPPQGDPAGDPPGLRLTAPALTLELKEPWQRASPFAQQLSAAALDAHLAPLAARVAALEARAVAPVAAPVEGAGVVYRYADPHEPADALLQCVSGTVGLVLIR